MSDIREGDMFRPFSQTQFITSQHMARSDDIQDMVQEKFRASYARQTHVNGDGQTLYLDMDTVIEHETVTEQDFLRDGVRINMYASAVFRLPRRSDLIEHKLDLLAYDIGSSFLREDGMVSVLTDQRRPAFMVVHPMQERYMPSALLGDSFPLRPLWQPEYPMTKIDVMNGGYDRDGVPALHTVRVEDSIPMPLYGGAL